MRVGIIGGMSGNGRPRVAITGIGVVSPYGVGGDCFCGHVSGCSVGTRRAHTLSATHVYTYTPPDFSVRDARDAWANAGLRLNETNAAVLVGSGAGGIDVAER